MVTMGRMARMVFGIICARALVQSGNRTNSALNTMGQEKDIFPDLHCGVVKLFLDRDFIRFGSLICLF
jgi:hypothetical protein